MDAMRLILDLDSDSKSLFLYILNGRFLDRIEKELNKEMTYPIWHSNRSKNSMTLVMEAAVYAPVLSGRRFQNMSSRVGEQFLIWFDATT